MIATYVIVWTMVVSSICILLLHLLIKRTDLIIRYGIRTLLVSAFLIILRLLIPYEFDYVLYQIEFPSILFLPLQKHYLMGSRLLLTDLILYIYLAVTAILLLHYSLTLYELKKKLWRHSLPVPEGETILHEIDPESFIIVRSNPLIKTPLLTGNHNPIIYLPEYDLSESNLFHIMLHEYTHWKHHHPIIKEFVHILRILLWWNPLSYIFEKDISHLLELVCDDFVSGYYNELEKISYLNTILHCLISASNSRNSLYSDGYFIGFAQKDRDAITKQRFHYQLSKEAFKGKPIWNFVIYSVMIACFIASYVIVVQPFFTPKFEETSDIVISSENSYLKELKDGNYNFYYDGQVIWVPKKDVDDGLYCIYEIIPYESAKKQPKTKNKQ